MQRYMVIRGRSKDTENILYFCNTEEEAQEKVEQITHRPFSQGGSYRIEKTSVYKGYLKSKGEI